MLQIVFLSSSIPSQQTQCFMATACEFSSPQTLLLLPCYTWLWSEEWCKRRGQCLGWQVAFLWSSSALRTMDHDKSTDTYQKGDVCYCPQRTTEQSICVCVYTDHRAATMLSQAQHYRLKYIKTYKEAMRNKLTSLQKPVKTKPDLCVYFFLKDLEHGWDPEIGETVASEKNKFSWQSKQHKGKSWLEGTYLL